MERGSAIHGGRGCTAKGAPRGRGRGYISRSCPITPPLLPSSVAEGFAWVGTTGCGQQVGACGLGIAWAAWERRPRPARTCCLCSGSSLPPKKVLSVFSLPCSFSADSAGHSCKRPVGASGFQSAPSAPPGAAPPRPVFLEGGPNRPPARGALSVGRGPQCADGSPGGPYCFWLRAPPPPGAALASGLAVTSTLVWRSLAGPDLRRARRSPPCTAAHACLTAPRRPGNGGHRTMLPGLSRLLLSPPTSPPPLVPG